MKYVIYFKVRKVKGQKGEVTRVYIAGQDQSKDSKPGVCNSKARASEMKYAYSKNAEQCEIASSLGFSWGSTLLKKNIFSHKKLQNPRTLNFSICKNLNLKHFIIKQTWIQIQNKRQYQHKSLTSNITSNKFSIRSLSRL